MGFVICDLMMKVLSLNNNDAFFVKQLNTLQKVCVFFFTRSAHALTSAGVFLGPDCFFQLKNPLVFSPLVFSPSSGFSQPAVLRNRWRKNQQIQFDHAQQKFRWFISASGFSHSSCFWFFPKLFCLVSFSKFEVAYHAFASSRTRPNFQALSQPSPRFWPCPSPRFRRHSTISASVQTPASIILRSSSVFPREGV